jgi:tight adherence protein B
VSGAEALPLVLAAAATLAWPPASAAGRVRALRPRADHGQRPGVARVPVVVPAGAGLVLAVLVAGVGGAVAVSVLGAVLLRARATRRRERARTETVAALAEGLAAFAAELRAGHPPASAAAAAGRDAGPGCRGALTLVEATARLGGDVPAALRDHAATDPLAGPHLVRLADAWSLADRHGIGLAGLAEAVAEDLRARSRFAGHLSAQLVGAHPLVVLTGTGVGQGLLVVGSVLVAAGLEWSARLTAGVVR